MEDTVAAQFRADAQKIEGELLPDKSATKYEQCYENFNNWRKSKHTVSFSEDVFLVYFKELSNVLKPSTLWSRWSMLKKIMDLKHNVDLNEFKKLKAFVKKQNVGFKAKKSYVFTRAQFDSFLSNADDKKYLDVKVTFILGIFGGLRTCEFTNLRMSNIHDTGSRLSIDIMGTKTTVDRDFVVANEYYTTVKKYMALRPINITTDRFFLNYKDGKCTIQVIGKNKFSAMPKVIATFLNLPNVNKYTGHCFRRTSATLLSNAGANITTIKQHGGWQSDKVAEGYLANSAEKRGKIFEAIAGTSIASGSRTETNPVEYRGKCRKRKDNSTGQSSPRTLPSHESPRKKQKTQTSVKPTLQISEDSGFMEDHVDEETTLNSGSLKLDNCTIQTINITYTSKKPKKKSTLR